MTRGIVKIKPKLTGKGSVKLDEVDPGSIHKVGDTLTFMTPVPDFGYEEGHIVECQIISDGFCKISRRIA